MDVHREIVVGDGRADPGVFRTAHDMLAPFLNSHRRAIIVLDAAWDGSPGAEAIRAGISRRMVAAGWSPERFVVVVIEPELEAWIWQDNPHVAEAFRFPGEIPLRGWLEAKGEWPKGQSKPTDPKRAVEKVCRFTRTPRSSATYRRITERVSIRSCCDRAFLGLTEALRRWFPPDND